MNGYGLWRISIIPIALIFSFRMFGLFMLIPVFTLIAPQLAHATPTLIGMALGAYGLSQGLLQLPFGMLSDKFGRKPLIAMGLILFAIGSLIGAATDSIYGMLVARMLQGMGAIGSVLIALLSDLTPTSERTKAMAAIGASIGLSFTLAMGLSPFLVHLTGLSGIFYVTAALAVLGLFILYKIIPSPSHTAIKNPLSWAVFKTVLTDKALRPFNMGIFFQHFILTATFFAIPLLLNTQIHSGHTGDVSIFYLTLMPLSFICMIPLIVIAERKKCVPLIFFISTGLITLAQCLLLFMPETIATLWGVLLIYFIAFNNLEATLPSLVSKTADPDTKGTAMGIYSSCQFLGIFAGGITAGLIYQYASLHAIFLLNGLIGVLWLLASRKITAKKT